MTRPSTARGAPGLALLSLHLLLAAGCGAGARGEVLTCTLPADCGPAARCVAGACQASTPPSADFTLPATLTTNRPVAVTATASDPDPGDGVASWAWTITRLTGGCDADVDAGEAATLQAVFWCAGTYEVALVVTDAAGAVGSPVRRTATVTALEGAPTVTAGPPVTVDHQCAGQPLQCGLASPVSLAADGQAPLGGPLTFHWSARPPDASRAGAAVLLTPGPTARDPLLALATDGGPISGAWRLRVRAEDVHGNLAQAVQVVTVGNRAPVLGDAPLAFDHAYDGRYRVDGALAVPVTDPDGDPVELSLALDEPAGSGCAASLEGVVGAAGRLLLSCPTPDGLMAAGRTLRATVTDANGAATSAALPVRALNRLPVVQPAGGLTELALDHAVGPCPDAGECFLVTGQNPFVASDPDGDPVTAVTLAPAVEAGRPHAFAAATAGPDGGTFTFGAPTAYPAEFRAASGASGFWLTATASDPFGASAPAQPALPVRVLNRPPVLASGPASVQAGHRYDAALQAYTAGAAVAAFVDPDGDPLVATASEGDASCATFDAAGGLVSVSCRRGYAAAPASFPTLAGFAGDHPLTPRASDGWETTAGAVTLTITSVEPTAADYDGAVEACKCVCHRWDPEVPGACAGMPVWAPDPQHATFAVRPQDLDGDPLAATFTLAPGSPAGATLSPASVTGLPAMLAPTVSSTTFPVTVLVSVNDGVGSALAAWTVRQVTCATTGQLCENPVPARR